MNASLIPTQFISAALFVALIQIPHEASASGDTPSRTNKSELGISPPCQHTYHPWLNFLITDESLNCDSATAAQSELNGLDNRYSEDTLSDEIFRARHQRHIKTRLSSHDSLSNSSIAINPNSVGNQQPSSPSLQTLPDYTVRSSDSKPPK